MTNIETRKITSESKKHQRDQVPRELINKISNLSQEVKRLEKSPEVNVKYIRQKNQEIKELE
ncbi:6561_t:CDS:1, partial [Racocetra persica]